jgi:hypothetical protein
VSFVSIQKEKPIQKKIVLNKKNLVSHFILSNDDKKASWIWWKRRNCCCNTKINLIRKKCVNFVSIFIKIKKMQFSSWFFHIEPNTEGLEGLHPNIDSSSSTKTNLFRSVLRRFKGSKSSKEAAAFQPDGAQSIGLIPVEGSVSSARCAGMNFGVQADEVLHQKDNSGQVERKVTFQIACSSLESANHGVSLGLAPPDVKRDTPMIWDEPNAVMFQCATNSATLWSDHLQEYGTPISDQPCLFPMPQKDPSVPPVYVGKVQLVWNIETGTLNFSLFNPLAEKQEISGKPFTREYFVKKSQYSSSSENAKEMFASLKPTVAFSTVVNEDVVTLVE